MYTTNTHTDTHTLILGIHISCCQKASSTVYVLVKDTNFFKSNLSLMSLLDLYFFPHSLKLKLFGVIMSQGDDDIRTLS